MNPWGYDEPTLDRYSLHDCSHSYNDQVTGGEKSYMGVKDYGGKRQVQRGNTMDACAAGHVWHLPVNVPGATHYYGITKCHHWRNWARAYGARGAGIVTQYTKPPRVQILVSLLLIWLVANVPGKVAENGLGPCNHVAELEEAPDLSLAQPSPGHCIWRGSLGPQISLLTL